jgi:hypothetical protein
VAEAIPNGQPKPLWFLPLLLLMLALISALVVQFSNPKKIS